MKRTPIKNEKEYQKALKELEKVFDAELGTPNGEVGKALVLNIEKYEKEHFPIENIPRTH